MPTKNMATTLSLEPSPPSSSEAIAWVLHNFLDELYYKKSHFAGLRKTFDRSKRDELERRLEDAARRQVLEQLPDPVDYVLHEVQEVVQPGHENLPAQWAKSETTLNARLVLTLACMGSQNTSVVLSSLIEGSQPLPPLVPVRLEGRLDGLRPDGTFGQPDMLLQGGRTLFMLEMKVRGISSARATYGPEQLLKYLSLAEYSRCHFGIEQVFHLIMVPDNGVSPFRLPHAWLEGFDRSLESITVRWEGLEDATRIPKWGAKLKDSEWKTKMQQESQRTAIYRVPYRNLQERVMSLVPQDTAMATQYVRQLDKVVLHAEPEPRT